MDFTSTDSLDGDVIERAFTLGDIPGILWTPSTASADTPAPIILLGHPGDIGRMHPRLAARARSAAADGFAALTIELPGGPGRTPLVEVERARADLRRALQAGEPVTPDVIDRLILPLVERAVPEWQATMEAVLSLDEIGGPVGFSGGVIAIAVRLAAVDQRVRAAALFAGSFVPTATLTDAAQVTIPLHVLLQWDDEGNDRQQALDLFDALGSADKTLEANMGGHTGVPPHAGESAARFFARHLRATE